jgi:hypothetical protein
MAAQETYENVKIAQEDLNGTARYVGMGGAMEALGADISTISTNPAGIGLFRKSNINLSFGLVSQADVSNAVGGNKTNASFDQVGFVYSARTGRTSFLNLAFNFHKSRNFDMILSAAAPLDRASQSKLTYAKDRNGLCYPMKKETKEGQTVDVPDYANPYASCNQLDDIYSKELNFFQNAYFNGSDYQFDRAHKGYIGEYDFNISGNINNRVYLGLTVGLHDVHYKGYSEYRETLTEIVYKGTPEPLNNEHLTVADSREITGTGFDVKLGVIFRPVEASPFRIGLSVATPTFYDLRTNNTTTISDANTSFQTNGGSGYKFKLYTPWKFGLSMGHTIGTQIALGASYEYADYSSMDSRNITGRYYDSWTGTYSDNSASDKEMNDHTDRTLKGVHTLKVGAEFKPDKDIALRIGYNYVSPMFQKDGFKDGTLNSNGTFYASATDFTNWEATHRLTVGGGYTIDHFNVSLAYQYSTTKGTFYPFMSYTDHTDAQYDNIAGGVSVKNNRHQLLLTLGYTF